ncbi:unnamed protein product [Pleuronectes platessa]|uniref:Uncharacterized protein n=1 Tax=Pleuronectes platessa TaxID=8262 RepID=A0A9N7URW8_PLEPL|nr:unnamed protein product [Pleuronectes platessa]
MASLSSNLPGLTLGSSRSRTRPQHRRPHHIVWSSTPEMSASADLATAVSDSDLAAALGVLTRSEASWITSGYGSRSLVILPAHLLSALSASPRCTVQDAGPDRERTPFFSLLTHGKSAAQPRALVSVALLSRATDRGHKMGLEGKPDTTPSRRLWTFKEKTPCPDGSVSRGQV